MDEIKCPNPNDTANWIESHLDEAEEVDNDGFAVYLQNTQWREIIAALQSLRRGQEPVAWAYRRNEGARYLTFQNPASYPYSPQNPVEEITPLFAAPAWTWQPIATAPENVKVWLWTPEGPECGYAAHGWPRNVAGVSNMSYHGRATHWQPIIPPSTPR